MNKNMEKDETVSQRLDQFARQHPRLLWLVNGFLMLFVTLVMITTAEAPVVLYQAF
jgi:hypothetical protein